MDSPQPPTRKRRAFLIAGLLGLALSSTASAATLPGNIVANPSFESPVVPQGGFQTFNDGSSFDGWTVGGGPVSIVSGSFQEGATRPRRMTAFSGWT